MLVLASLSSIPFSGPLSQSGRHSQGPNRGHSGPGRPASARSARRGAEVLAQASISVGSCSAGTGTPIFVARARNHFSPVVSATGTNGSSLVDTSRDALSRRPSLSGQASALVAFHRRSALFGVACWGRQPAVSGTGRRAFPNLSRAGERSGQLLLSADCSTPMTGCGLRLASYRTATVTSCPCPARQPRGESRGRASDLDEP